jgi:hypothetical protein
MKHMVQLMQQQQSEILQLRSTVGRQSQLSDAIDRLTSHINTLESTIAARIAEHFHQQARTDCIHLSYATVVGMSGVKINLSVRLLLLSSCIECIGIICCCRLVQCI